MKSRFLQITVILGLSLLGALFRQSFPNALSWRGQWPGSNASALEAYKVFAKPGDPPFIGLMDALDIQKTGQGIFLDARSKGDFAKGRIPHARNLPFYEMDAFQDAALAGAESGTLLVVYCEGIGCELSFLMGRELQGAGYTNVQIFYGGYPEWTAAGLPIEK